MADNQSGAGGLFGKAQEELDKLMDDPSKVDKAKSKAEGILGKHMDQQQADEVTNAAEGLLKDWADGADKGGSSQ